MSAGENGHRETETDRTARGAAAQLATARRQGRIHLDSSAQQYDLPFESAQAEHARQHVDGSGREDRLGGTAAARGPFFTQPRAQRLELAHEKSLICIEPTLRTQGTHIVIIGPVNGGVFVRSNWT